MGKNYKEYPRECIGTSDISTLIVASPDISAGSGRGGDTGLVKELWFGADNVYNAYIVDDECEIPAHYSHWATGRSWLKIYDDQGISFSCYANMIRIYRAGDFGVIIQIIPGATQ